MDWLTDSHSFATQGFYSGFWMDCIRDAPVPDPKIEAQQALLLEI